MRNGNLNCYLSRYMILMAKYIDNGHKHWKQENRDGKIDSDISTEIGYITNKLAGMNLHLPSLECVSEDTKYDCMPLEIKDKITIPVRGPSDFKEIGETEMSLLIDLQYKLNEQILGQNPHEYDKDKKYNGKPVTWDYYLYAELGEAYEWLQETDVSEEERMSEIITELIDTLHFAMSYEMQFLRTKDIPIKTNRTILSDNTVQGVLLNLMHTITTNGIDYVYILDALYALGLSGDDIYNRYMAKNALNVVRQRNGYKTGEYNKKWGNKEDNAIFLRVINEYKGKLETLDDYIDLGLKYYYLNVLLQLEITFDKDGNIETADNINLGLFDITDIIDGSSVTVVYHNRCNDGSGSLYSTMQCKYIGINGIVPLTHGKYDEAYEEIDSIDSDTIIFVDCSPTVEFVEKHKDYTIVIVDHHKSPINKLMEDLRYANIVRDNLFFYYDNSHSGAYLTWSLLHSEPVPEIILDIEDRDIWKWERPNTKAVYLALRANGLDAESLDLLDDTNYDNLVSQGKVLVNYNDTLVNSTIRDFDVVETANGKKVAILASIPDLVSEALNRLLLNHDDIDMAVGIVIKKDGISVSIRSTNNRPNSVTLARALDGDGHRNASGGRADSLEALKNTIRKITL